MRILAVRGRNLASLAGDFEIDLAVPPLGQAGVFAIHGPVGAGKTTLLDAICLALYDRTPRGARGATRLKLPEGDEITARDPRAVLRRGAADGRAEVEFEAGGRTYRATWSVRRSRDRSDGRLQEQSIELLDLATGRRWAGNKTEVLREIERIVGLSWDQFCRSALLAQGEFAAFLLAKPAERAELLERMTGTATYAAIGQAAFERATSERERLAELDQQIASHGGLGAEPRADLDRELARSEAAARDGEARAAGLRALVGAVEERARREGAVASSRSGLAAQEGVVAGLADRRAWLGRLARVEPLRRVAAVVRDAMAAAARAAEHLRGALARAAATREEVVVRRGEVERAHAAAVAARGAVDRVGPDLARARELDAAIAAAASRVEERSAAVEAARLARAAVDARIAALDRDRTTLLLDADGARRWLAQHAGLAAIAPRWSSVKEHLALLPALQAEQARLESGLARARVAVSEAERASAERFEQVRRGTADADAARARVPPAPDELSAATARAEVEVRRGRQRRAVAEALRVARADHARTGQERAHWEETLAEAVRRIEAASADLRIAVAVHDEATRAARRLEATVSLASRRAELLVAGEPCPLCLVVYDGSSVTHEHPVEQALAEARAAAAERKARSDALEAAIAGDRARVGDARQRLERLDPTTGDRVLRAESAWLDAGGGDPEAADAALADAEAAFERARHAEQEGRAAIAESRRLDQAVEQGRQAAESARLAAEHAGAALARYEGDLGRLAARASATREVLERALGDLPRWREEADRDPTALVAAIDADLRQMDAMRDTVLRADVGEAGFRREEGALRAERESRHAVVVAAEGAREAAAADHAARVAERAALLGGRAAGLVEAELTTASRRAEQAAVAAARALATAEARLAESDGEARAREASELDLRERAAAERARWADELAGLGLTETEAEALLSVDEGERARVAAEVEAADRELERRRVRFEEATDALGRCPPAPDVDPRSELADLEAAQASLATTIGGLRFQVALDDRARTARLELEPRRDRQRRQVETWDAMADLIGSKDGGRFRVYAQGLTLDALVAYANSHLAELANRYRLARVPGSDLDMMVIDRTMAEEARTLNTLSGGETFLVSLALALALSSLSSRNIEVRTLFVDEGFGTLDPDTLEVALSALDALQASGRQVGLISHIPGIADRIGARVEVVPVSAGASRVRVAC